MRIFNAVIIIVMVSSVVAADAYTIYGILKYPNNTAVQYEEIFIDCEPHAYDCAKFSGESTMSDFGGGYRLELAYDEGDDGIELILSVKGETFKRGY